ncbi:MAG: PQQ-dependent dehydrogenase, methanol/ethanol family [Gemmatimonadota bacterium]
MITRVWPLGTALLAALTAACAGHSEFPITQESRPFTAYDASLTRTAPDVTRTVNAQRLVHARAESHNWLTYYGAYDGQRYSTLDQITAGNVPTLKPAWTFQAGVIGLIAAPATFALEATPIVVDGVMFLTGWDGYVWALDAVTGKVFWRYRQAIPLDVPLCCGNVNRGAAVAQGKVFFVTANGHLVALDATTGKVVWDRTFADVRAGESATLAPLIVKNLVIVGSSGAEYGVRGHIDAFDLNSGRQVWRRYNVPKPGEPGSETWPSTGEAWARGGGAAWITGTYDAELDLLYWGVANPSPDYDGSVRPGDNLYTNSVVALDPDDGSLRWHYQWTPHDLWDYDGVNENILFDHDGRKLLAHFDKNGHLYILDRTNGRHIRATPFVRTTFGTVDASTGKLTPRLLPTAQGQEICPGPAGGKEWNHAAYNPRTGLLYVPVVEQCAVFKSKFTEFREGMAYWGGEATPVTTNQWGHVKAFDPATGREVWSWRGRHPMVGSLLTTAGDLVFGGEPTGEFNAYHARTGELLWQYQTGSGIHGSAITYSVAGKQYVAVTSGWGGWMKGFAPELYGATRGSALFVFALP